MDNKKTFIKRKKLVEEEIERKNLELNCQICRKPGKVFFSNKNKAYQFIIICDSCKQRKNLYKIIKPFNYSYLFNIRKKNYNQDKIKLISQNDEKRIKLYDREKERFLILSANQIYDLFKKGSISVTKFSKIYRINIKTLRKVLSSVDKDYEILNSKIIEINNCLSKKQSTEISKIELLLYSRKLTKNDIRNAISPKMHPTTFAKIIKGNSKMNELFIIKICSYLEISIAEYYPQFKYLHNIKSEEQYNNYKNELQKLKRHYVEDILKIYNNKSTYALSAEISRFYKLAQTSIYSKINKNISNVKAQIEFNELLINYYNKLIKEAKEKVK